MADDQRADKYSEQEAEQRFEALLRAALNTPPKPMKDIPRQRPYQPRKQKAPASKSRSRA